MSKLTDKIFLMRNMDDEELKDYIKILTDNEKDLIIFNMDLPIMAITQLINFYKKNDGHPSFLLLYFSFKLTQTFCQLIRTACWFVTASYTGKF